MCEHLVGGTLGRRLYQASNRNSGSGSPTEVAPESKHLLSGELCPSPAGLESCPKALEPCTSGCQPGRRRGVPGITSMATCLAALVQTFPHSSKGIRSSEPLSSQVSHLSKSTHLQNGSWASRLRRCQGRGLSKAREHQGKAQVSDGT